jgi:hypothetical protein
MLLSSSCNFSAILWNKSVSKFKSAATCLILACALAIPVTAGTIIVSNTNDSGPGSLRQALVDANDGDTIDATGISGAITLTTGELAVDKSVTINAGGADVLAVDGNATSRLFQIGTGKTVTISGLTIRNGHDDTTGGGINNESGATLTITNSTLSGNTAGSVNNPAVEGGGIFNSGTLTIVSSTVSANTAGGTSGSGGGIENLGTLTILNSTFSGNTAIKGGGIHNSGPATAVTITNSTLSGNSASAYGGACFNGGTMQITNSTLSGNSAFTGGGILVFGPLEIGTTILNRGDSGANIDSFGEVTVTSLGHNLSSDDGSGHLTGPGDQINTDPVLGPLQNNGGPTFTHSLLPGSPAIDAGDPNFTPPPFFDQRGQGFNRVVNGRLDIGSFEVQTQTVAIQLEASGRKVGGINTVRLTWTGATSNNVDVNRDGIVIATVPNTGTYTDSTGDTGRARYTYEVCEAGTSTCSNAVTVRFRH